MDNLEEFGLVDDADIALDEAALALALLDHDEIDIGPYEDGLSDMASRPDAVGAGIQTLRSVPLASRRCLPENLAFQVMRRPTMILTMLI